MNVHDLIEWCAFRYVLGGVPSHYPLTHFLCGSFISQRERCSIDVRYFIFTKLVGEYENMASIMLFTFCHLHYNPHACVKL